MDFGAVEKKLSRTENDISKINTSKLRKSISWRERLCLTPRHLAKRYLFSDLCAGNIHVLTLKPSVKAPNSAVIDNVYIDQSTSRLNEVLVSQKTDPYDISEQFRKNRPVIRVFGRYDRYSFAH